MGRLVRVGLLLSLAGAAIPPALWVFARTETGKSMIERFAIDAIRDELGLRARVEDVQLSLVPLEVSVTDVTLDDPVYGRLGRVRHLTLRPSILAVLQGRGHPLSSIEADGGAVRLVIRNGEIVNLPRPRRPPAGDSEVPFADLAAGGIRVDVDFAPSGNAILHDVDLDVVAGAGGAVDVRVVCLRAFVQHPYGHDVLSRVEARARISPSGATIHLLHLQTPEVRLVIERARIPLPLRDGYEARVSLDANLDRLNTLNLPFDRPVMRGAVSLVAQVRGLPDGPHASGRVRLTNVHLDQWGFGDSADLDVEASPQRVAVRRGVFRLLRDGGEVAVRASVGLGRGIPIEATIEPRGMQFAKLMDQLGVTPDAIVSWLMEGSIHLRGTGEPLHIEGPIELETRDFHVTRGPYHHPRGHVIGVARAHLRGRTRITPRGLEFVDVRADFGRSTIVASTLLGFDDTLRVHAEATHLDLSDGSPLLDFSMGGIARINLDVTGVFTEPVLRGHLGIAGFSFDTFPFGDVEGRAELHGLRLTFPQLDLTKRDSRYALHDAYLDFENDRFAAGGHMVAQQLWLHDFFHMFHYENDERFEPYETQLAGTADIRYTMDFPGDGAHGTMNVEFGGDLSHTVLQEQSFDAGHIEGTWHWFDWQQGYEGGDLRLRRFELTRGEGSVTTRGTMRRGQLDFTVVADHVALMDLDKIRARGVQVDGSVGIIARVSGPAGLPRADIDLSLTGVRIADADLGDARVYVRLTDADDPWVTSSLQPRSGDPVRDACRWSRRGLARNGWPEDPPVQTRDGPQRALDRPQAWLVCGQTNDGRLRADIALGRTAVYPIRGRVYIGDVPLDPWLPRRAGTDPVTGVVAGTLTFTRGALFEPETLKGRVRLRTLRVGQRNLTLANDGPIRVAFERGDFTVQQAELAGESTRLRVSGGGTMRGELALTIDGAVDLSFLSGLTPSLEESSGRVTAQLRINGSVDSPSFFGEARVRDAGLRLRDFDHPISNLSGRVTFSQRRFVLEDFRADFAGGTLGMRGGVELAGTSLRSYEMEVRARDLSLDVAEDVPITFGADGTLTWAEGDRIPALRGEVHVARLRYGRSIDIGESLDALGRSARRAEVEEYDPERDHVSLDLRVRDEAPARITNNLVDMELRVDDSERPLRVVGTDQRFGILGTVRVTRGLLRFRNTEFQLRRGVIDFDDEHRIDPHFDLLAETEIHRGGGDIGSPHWRISLHAFGTGDHVQLEPSSEPALSQEDIILLLTIGLTRAEADRLQADQIGQTAAIEALATVTGVDREVRRALPVIDDFRLTSAYSRATGRTEPQVTIGRRITDRLRVSATTGFGETRDFRALVEWRLGDQTSLQAVYDNANSTDQSAIGNLGLDLRWRLEFE